METYRFEVGGNSYDYTPIGALEASRLLGRVNSILGIGLRHSTGGGSDEVTVAAIVGGLMSNLGDPDVVEIFKRFARNSNYLPDKAGPVPLGDPNGDCLNFDMHFARRTKDMFVWFWKCFAWQYEDFLESISSGVLSKLVDLIPSLLTYLESLTGSSGESSPPSESAKES